MRRRPGLRRVASALLSATLTVASAAFLALLALALITGFFVPLLSDEVATHLGNARIFEEHGTTVSLLPQYSATWVQKVPVALYPGAALLTLAYQDVGLLGLKISGVVGAVVGMAGVAWLACRGVKTRRDRLHVVAGLCAISSLGVVPFIVILSRSEQPMKLCLIAICVLTLVARRRARRVGGHVVTGAAFLLLASLLFFNHTKALFFLPFVLAAAVLIAPPGRQRRWWCALVVPCVLLMAWQSFRQAAELVVCDEAPELARWFGRLTLVPRDALVDPGTFFAAGWKNLVSMPAHAWSEVIFSANNTNWVPLPRLWRLSPAVRDLNETTASGFVALVWGIPVLLLLAYRRREPRARASVVLGGALVIGIAANAFFYKAYPFYNCGLLMPALSLVAALAIAARDRPLLPRVIGQLGVLALLALGLANLGALLHEFGPKLVEARTKVGPTVADQPAALPIFGYELEKTKIRALASACGIEGDGATHLVIDDYTLHAFAHLRQPLDLIYVTDAIPWLGLTLAGDKLPALLRRLESPGIIGRCTYFPKTLRGKATVSEAYCCVGKSAFDPPATPP
ncbi:MAG TPA: hypothetical protein VLT33_30640 [Labilithrix sp.]|nr:hypothetical protein [Labilithrix sp.]